MKKFVKSVLFLCLMFSFTSAFAQSSILEMIKDVDLQEILRAYPSLTKHDAQEEVRAMAKSSARANSNVHALTERARIPEISKKDSPKYYYIKNAATGEYLHYEGLNAGLKTVPENKLDAAAEFFLDRSWYNVGNDGALYNRMSGDYSFNGPESNKWSKSSFSRPAFYFLPLSNGSGCYISSKSEGGSVWRYDTTTGTVVSSDIRDNYSVWLVEALPETPVVSTKADPVWYVVKNVNTGRYLHYEGASSPMSLVKSPDPCSLFFVLDADGDAGEEIELHNYEAGELIYNGANQWSTMSAPIQFVRSGTTDQFFIKENGGATIWNGNSGTLAMGSSGVNSLWEFEKITNFKDVFGFHTGSSFEDELKLLEDMFMSKMLKEELAFYQTYTLILSYLVLNYNMGVSIINFSAAQAIQNSYSTLKSSLETDAEDMTKDMIIRNIGHESVTRNLATNSTSLLFDDAEYLHTNAWQLFLKDVDKLECVLYNTVTKMYVAKSQMQEDGSVTIGMTANKDDAEGWSLVDPYMESGDGVFCNVRMTALLESTGIPGCFLQLANPNDLAVSCVMIERDEENKIPGDILGLKWEFLMGNAVIDERVYDYAAELAARYPQQLRQTDSFTKGNGYLQVDLGDGNALSEFYFYMKPNLQSWQGVPVSITVSGSNSANGDFVELAEVETSALLYDRSYFSELVTAGVEFRYLRFTIDEVTGGGREFALAEFYILPNTPEVAEIGGLIRDFYDASYMGVEILVPAVELIKLEAEYYLDEYKDHQTASPGQGECSPQCYNALLNAYNAVNINDKKSIIDLIAAIENFFSADFAFVCIIESAWEDGYSNGRAFGLNSSMDDYAIQDFNAWDMRQWVIIDKKGNQSNPYSLELVCERGMLNFISLSEIQGWNQKYSSHRDAYNIFINSPDGDNASYLAVKDSDSEVPLFISSPATVEKNNHAAWYLTVVSNSDKVARVGIDDEYFINSMADFGKIYAQARYYIEGLENGQFIYQGPGLTDFLSICDDLEPYYDYGALRLADMYVAGEIGEGMLDVLNNALKFLQSHFPYFMVNSATTIAGVYFRLRGTDGYLTSNAEGNFSISSSSEANIYYTQAFGDEVSMMSFSSGRYVKANADGSVAYDEIPLLGGSITTQKVGLGISLSGANGYNSIIFGGNLYLSGSVTGNIEVTTSPQNNGNCDWVVEALDKLPISISAAQYATLYVPVELKIPAGVKAYVLYDEATTGTNSDIDALTGIPYGSGQRVLRLMELKSDENVIPAGLPVIIQGDEGIYNFTINYNPKLTTETERRKTYCYDGDIINLLHGFHAATYIPESAGHVHYILANKSLGVGMYKVKMNSSVGGVSCFLNNAHRAWLPNPVKVTSGAAGYRFSVTSRNGSTSIDDVMNGAAEQEIYDLQGRRVSNMTKGVYIVNGKKVIK